MPEVIGAINDKWKALEAQGVVLGAPLDVEKPTADGVGRAQEFAGGTISWHPELGAFATWGAIRDRWLALGREGYGYLLTDESPCPDGRGRYNHYRAMQLADRPDGSIYWTPETGAVEVYGGIRAKWSELGWERCWLGYPTSAETDFPDGGRVTTFEHGAVYWWADTGAIDLGDVVVRYRGMNAFGETNEASGSDEPYYLVGVLAGVGQRPTFRTRVYEDVDAGGSFPDGGAEVYRGQPFGVDLAVTGMEHDDGDPDKYRDLVTQAVGAAATGIEAALAATGVGAPVALAVAPLLGVAVPVLVDAVNDLLGTADDTIATVPLPITAKQLCLLPSAGLQSERDVQFHLASPLISDGEASYKAYFDVVRA